MTQACALVPPPHVATHLAVCLGCRSSQPHTLCCACTLVAWHTQTVKPTPLLCCAGHTGWRATVLCAPLYCCAGLADWHAAVLYTLTFWCMQGMLC